MLSVEPTASCFHDLLFVFILASLHNVVTHGLLFFMQRAIFVALFLLTSRRWPEIWSQVAVFKSSCFETWIKCVWHKLLKKNSDAIFTGKISHYFYCFKDNLFKTFLLSLCRKNLQPKLFRTKTRFFRPTCQKAWNCVNNTEEHQPNHHDGKTKMLHYFWSLFQQQKSFATTCYWWSKLFIRFLCIIMIDKNDDFQELFDFREKFS